MYPLHRSCRRNPWVLLADIGPDRDEFAHLNYPPFILDAGRIDLSKFRVGWGDLRIDGFLNGKQAISKTLSGKGVDSRFVLVADDHDLMADGADATRVVLRVTDEFGAIRPYANDPIALTLEGPGKLIGDNPFSLIGGTGAVWVRAGEESGTVLLKARHPRLGEQTAEIVLKSTTHEHI